VVDRYIEKILRARVYEVARETPLEPAPRLSRRLGCQVLLKREDLQPTFSFKLRGAYNKIAGLDRASAGRGVIAASAGNHAQGVALAAERLGLKAVIVMPRTTPEIKVESVRELGAEVVLHGDSYDEAHARSLELCAQSGLTYIHPYDDPDVIAGQGTIAVELLRQCSGPLDAVFVPVGGGGLIAGITSYVKFLRPEVRVIGVEPEGAACLAAALRAGRPVALDEVDLFADGVAVSQVGSEPFRLVRDRIEGVVTVSTDEICAAILDLYQDTRSIAEPAGALALAGLKKHAERHGVAGQTHIALVSGANLNFHRLRHISERVELGEHREAILAVTIPERPGSFRRFCEAIGDRSVTEFNYRYCDSAEAHVYVGLQLGERSGEREALIAELCRAGYPVVDLTDNELAKIHTRHLVGGRAPLRGGERVYSFDFPERPGALRRFLEGLSADLNITLFHYRNHGAAVGRVLAGLQHVGGDQARIQQFLDQVGYSYRDQTDNPAYRIFLS
jgi:threonine dehydratase